MLVSHVPHSPEEVEERKERGNEKNGRCGAGRSEVLRMCEIRDLCVRTNNSCNIESNVSTQSSFL